MKKETIIAISLGVLAGLGVAVVMLEKAHEHQMVNTHTITTASQLTPKATTKETQPESIDLQEPENGSISTERSVTIKGKSKTGSLMVIESPIKVIFQKLSQDTFSVPNFPLAIGENTIRVSVYSKDSQGAPQEKELKIYYLDEQ